MSGLTTTSPEVGVDGGEGGKGRLGVGEGGGEGGTERLGVGEGGTG